MAARIGATAAPAPEVVSSFRVLFLVTTFTHQQISHSYHQAVRLTIDGWISQGHCGPTGRRSYAADFGHPAAVISLEVADAPPLNLLSELLETSIGCLTRGRRSVVVDCSFEVLASKLVVHCRLVEVPNQ